MTTPKHLIEQVLRGQSPLRVIDRLVEDYGSDIGRQGGVVALAASKIHRAAKQLAKDVASSFKVQAEGGARMSSGSGGGAQSALVIRVRGAKEATADLIKAGLEEVYPGWDAVDSDSQIAYTHNIDL